jgi:hypothetical protein
MFRRVIIFLMLVLVAAQVVAQTPEPDAARVSEHHYAPYILMGAYPTFFMAKVAEDTGVRYFTLAFVQALGNECKPGWDGVGALEKMYFMPDLEKLRAAGGDVIVSFGGASGVELGRACEDVESLKAAYQEVVEVLGVTHLDFDLEGDDLDDPESIERRSQAIALLQAEYEGTDRELVISYTLPVLPSGLTENGMNTLQAAIDAGVEVEVVNIMTMNFGDPSAGSMGEHTIEAAESLVSQLQPIYPEKSDDELWSMVGLTPMIGINDVGSNIFTTEDAEVVTEFAAEKSIARLAMWSYERDEACINNQPVLMNNCSGTTQDPLAFSAIFNEFTDGLEP